MLFIKTIFGILCGCLYVIGLCFGWDYQETSVHICLRWWPAICLLSTLPIIIGLIMRAIVNKKRWLSLFLIPIAVQYTYYYIGAVLSIYTHYHPSWSIGYNFNKCMSDLQHIAATCGTTYEMVNLIIYVGLFSVIMLTNGFLSYLAFPKRTMKKDDTKEDITHPIP